MFLCDLCHFETYGNKNVRNHLHRNRFCETELNNINIYRWITVEPQKYMPVRKVK
jgi:hypothetical protein